MDIMMVVPVVRGSAAQNSDIFCGVVILLSSAPVMCEAGEAMQVVKEICRALMGEAQQAL